jgi:transcriptional regulator with XRE-family HTH domain
MKTQGSFGAVLRREREQRGVKLETVAASTMIRMSVLEDLEANGPSNVSHDFYRRALLRAYATAIGVPTDAILAEYYQHYSETGAGEGPRLRLIIEPDARWSERTVSRMLTVVADTCVVLLLAAIITQPTGTNLWVIGGAVALLYHALATATLGCSPAMWYANYVMLGGHTRHVRSREDSQLASPDEASAVSRS